MNTSQERMDRRRPMRARWLRAAAVCVVSVASLMPAPAYAQRSDETNAPPYDVPGLKAQTQVLPWIFGFVFIAICVAVGMKNPQRSQN